MSESPRQEADSGRKSEGKNPPHECFGCDKEYMRPHKRLVHMRDCCPDKLEPCPTCGTGYTNKQGVKLHHSREHNESIAKTDIYCERCGDFYKEVYECNIGSYAYCDDCREIVKSERMTGEKNPQYGTGDIIEYECRYCGEESTQPDRVGHKGVFCSADCRNEWLSENHRGENHSMWKGGRSYERYYYGPEWEDQREACLERDNYRCQSCGKTNDEASIALNAHHIKPFKTFDDRKEANKLENLVALCLSCHKKWEGLPVRPQLI